MKKGKERLGKKKRSKEWQNLESGREQIRKNDIFDSIASMTGLEEERKMGVPCKVDQDGKVYVDASILLEPEQWAYVLIHARMHLVFDHWNAEKMPGYKRVENGCEKWVADCNIRLWNLACDLYISRYLSGIHFGQDPYPYPFSIQIRENADELETYQELAKLLHRGKLNLSDYYMDMIDLDKPLYYEEGTDNFFAKSFIVELEMDLNRAIYNLEEKETGKKNPAERAAGWFQNSYPLLAGLASAFRVIYDSGVCARKGIMIAAVCASEKTIYVNPTANLSQRELRFVLAHEYLHVGLLHHSRRLGRDPYLWNVSTDFQINSYLCSMDVGNMPDGSLYDSELDGLSAESIYDELIKNLRRSRKLPTYCGYGKGDLLEGEERGLVKGGVSIDDFCKSALLQGLEYEQVFGRGTLPAGLVEEIKALVVPPIPWKVQLGEWLDIQFSKGERKRTYARASRRQSSTPDIPRPGYCPDDRQNSLTFGAVIDTSGSMDTDMLGIALGAIASYGAERQADQVRVICCDASAYDLGWIRTEEIAGRIEIQGRGGTILQPAVDFLEKAVDFPTDAPILVITDGEIEDTLQVHRNHAYLIPKGRSLPFRSRGEVFYFSEV